MNRGRVNLQWFACVFVLCGVLLPVMSPAVVLAAEPPVSAPMQQAQPRPRDPQSLAGVWWTQTFDPAYLPMDGKPIPFTPEGRKAYDQRLKEIKSGAQEDIATQRCIPWGVPRICAENEKDAKHLK